MKKPNSCLVNGVVRTSEYTKQKDNYKKTGFNVMSDEPVNNLRENLRKLIKDWQYEAYTVRRMPDASLIALINKLEEFCRGIIK